MKGGLTRGSSTLEILVASGLLALTVTAALPLALSGRELLTDTQTRTDALARAERALARAQVAALTDFQSAQSSTSTDGTYDAALGIEPVDLWTKRLVSAVSWRRPGGRTETVRLTSLVTNPDPEETCHLAENEGWRAPLTHDFDLANLVGSGIGTYPVTGVDAWNGRLYVTASGSGTKQSTFFVVDARDPANPTPLGQLDNDPAVKSGPNAVAVAPSGGRVYAYLASASSFARGQLQVVDVTEPVATGWAPTIVTYKIPTSIVPSAGLGNSILYRRGYVYLGLTSAVGGREFNVIDVRNPLHPNWVGGYSLQGHAVNAVRVRGSYAYLAHPAGTSGTAKEQLTVLDVGDPANPRRLDGFWASEGLGGNGKSLAVTSDRIYLGRTATRISSPNDTLPEFLVLDGQNLTDLPTVPLGTLNFDIAESANGVIARGDFVALLANNRLQAWNFAEPAVPQPWTPNGNPDEFLILPGKGASLDCEGDVLYVGGTTDAGRGFISIITPQP